MKSLNSFTLQGLVPTLDFFEAGGDQQWEVPRLFNNTVTYNKMDKGVLIPIDTQFHTVFTTG